jgi:hypothetical protein
MRGWIAAIIIALMPMGGFAQPATAPAPGAAAAPATEADRRPRTPAQVARQDRMRSCNAEARRRTVSAEARRGFMRECLANPRPTAAAPAANRTVSSQNTAYSSTAPTYATEDAARAGCGDEPVVWGNSDSRIFHLSGSRLYGRTQNGAYTCRGPAEMAGYRAAR